ncbi:hypothetical protein Yalta_040 [Yalta virus]|nr:hypothetical protein Yalta_040 [Yalta virus]
MSRLDNYIKSIDFLTSDIEPESNLLQNLNKKHYRDVKKKKKIMFIEVEDMDIELIKRNHIVFYPYVVKFKPLKANKIKIPIFLEKPSLLTSLLKHNKIKFKPIQVKDIKEDLNEKEREYYYQEELFLDVVLRDVQLRI